MIDSTTLIARDRDTGALLTEEEAETAADNPMIYRWVEWVSLPA